MSFGYGVGDIMAISGLALKVCTAYKDAPGDYKNISDEVESLHIIINKAAQHFEGPTLSNNSHWQQEGQKVLRGCQNVLEDLDALIEKYNSLASASTGSDSGQVLQRLKLSASLVLGTEDIATLRARLTSNTTLLNGLIQSYEFHNLDKIQARLDSVLGLHRTMSRDSVVPLLAGSTNTKKAYKKFWKDLFNIGVTAEMISQKKKEMQDTFKTQHPAASSQIDDSTSEDPNPAPHPQLPEVRNSSDAETSPISSISTKIVPNSRSRFSWVRPPIDFLVGPLMLSAAEAGNTKRLVSILEYVRNINFADDRNKTALHKAATKGHKEIVQLLLSKGGSLEDKDALLNTPLHNATCGGHTSTVELLLTKGASIEAMTESLNATPLHLAAVGGHTSTVELLLSKGASIEARDTTKRTPLHQAAYYGHTSTVELLLSKGASIEAMTEYLNSTPLHVAALCGHTSIVELLLSKGASIEATDIINRTPLHFAAFSGQTSTVEVLLSKGAPIEAMDKNGNTPLDLATLRSHPDTAKVLKSNATKLVTSRQK